MAKIVECVPNFSEGRDISKIEEIKKVICSVAGAVLLDVDPGFATNRTVVTIVGDPEAVLEAAFLSIKKASEIIDMRCHKGEHSRMGATDVCPFIPVAEMTMDEAVELSKRLAKRVGDELNIPVYLYEYSASKPERSSLAYIREGEYESFAEKIKKPGWEPDHGPNEFNQKAGATVIGARDFLIAYNLNLNTKNVKIANSIAKMLRESGYKKKEENGEKVQVEGLLKAVRAVGWYIDEYGIAQISVNLLNYKITPLWKLFDTASEAAMEKGIRITGSELVGLIPLEAMKETGEHYLKKAGDCRGVPEKELIDIAVRSLGLNELYEFKPQEKIIEYKIASTGCLTGLNLVDFNDELSSSSPAPGGGSVAALAGTLAASLVSMVANLTFGKKGYEPHFERSEQIAMHTQVLKDEIIKMVDSDTELFNEYMKISKMPKKTDEQKVLRDKCLKEASVNITRSPLELLKVLEKMIPFLKEIVDIGNKNSISDVGVSASMLRSAAEGAYLNVLINLPSLQDEILAVDFKEKARSLYDKIVGGSDSIFNKVLSLL